MTDAPQQRPPSILLVDDDPTFGAVLARSLRSRGYEVSHAASYDEAVGRLVMEPPTFAVVDLRMPGRSGLDLLDTIKRVQPATDVVLLTADRSPATRAEAMRRGASGYLMKPTYTDDIVAALEALGRRSD